jgi:superfamily II DNA or RNA helicase
MWLEVDCLSAKVTRATTEEQNWLLDYLAFPDATAHFKGKADGSVRMLNLFDGTFPAGLVPLVVKDAPDEGFRVEVVDKTQPTAPDPNADLDWLRDDQREAVRRVLEKRRGVLHLPTGSGKTEIGVALVRSVPCEWLFVVHRTTLGQQAAERFERRNVDHGVDLGPAGVIGEGAWSEGERLTCATFQSLVAALRSENNVTRNRARDLLGRVGGIIVDESHTLPAETFWSVAMKASRAAYRVGLSGTPLARGDRRSVLSIAALGPILYRLRAPELVEAGVLSRARVRLVPCRQLTGRPTWAGVYLDLVTKSKKRNALLVEIARRAEKPGFLFVKSIEHGKILERAVLQAGIPAAFVWGVHSTEWRKHAVRDLEAGRIEILVCSVVFQEGVDVPSLRSVINAAAGRSVIAAIQKAGRGMRVEKNRTGEVVKNEFEVWDVFDTGDKWLERAARERRRAYIREGYETIEEAIPVPVAKGERAE